MNREFKGSFSNDDGDGSEDVKKAIGLLRKTTSLHVHHAFLYISLPSLHDYDVKMPNCKFYAGRKQATTNLFLSLNLSAVLWKSTPGKFAYTCHFQQIGINTTKFEKTAIHFKTEISLPLPSSMLKLPNKSVNVSSSFKLFVISPLNHSKMLLLQNEENGFTISVRLISSFTFW